jgi:hypothetical protein
MKIDGVADTVSSAVLRTKPGLCGCCNTEIIGDEAQSGQNLLEKISNIVSLNLQFYAWAQYNALLRLCI